MRKNIIYDLLLDIDITNELENTEELKVIENKLEKQIKELLKGNYEKYFVLDETIGALILTYKHIYYRFGLKVGIDIARVLLETESE